MINKKRGINPQWCAADLLIMLQRAAPLLGREGGMSEGNGEKEKKEERKGEKEDEEHG